MKKKAKAASFFTLIIITISFYIASQNPPTSPYDFGFFTGEFTIPGQDLRVESYNNKMHTFGKIFITLYSIVKVVTGAEYGFLVSIPLILPIWLFIYALLKDLPSPIQIIGSVACIAGPVTIMGFFYSFRRDGLDLILILIFILLSPKLIRRNRAKSIPLFGLSLLASFLVWKLHYSVWPFLAVLIFVSLSFESYYNNVPRYVPLGTFFPLALDISTLTLFVGRAQLVLAQPLPDLLSSLTNIYSSRQRVIPASYTQLNAEIASQSPAWMPEGQYFAVFILLVPIAIIWTISVVLIRSPYRYLNPDITAVKRRQFLATVVATITTLLAYFIVGYAPRIQMFLPVILMIGVREVYLAARQANVSLSSNQLSPERIILVVVILLSLSHVIPLFALQYVNPDQAAFSTEQAQVESSSWARYVPDSDPIYTDLTHANHILIKTSHKKVIVGSINFNSSGLYISPNLRRLYHLHTLETYSVVTERGTRATVAWGGPIPPSDPSIRSGKANRIYANGMDAWFYGK